MKILHLFLFAAALISTTTHADRLSGSNSYYPKSFYADNNAGMNDEALKKALFKILSSAHVPGHDGNDTLVTRCQGQRSCYQHTPLSYSQARDVVLGELDLMEDNGHYALKDVYCQDMYTDKDFRRGQGPKQGHAPDHTVFNIEHTWPQSRFSSKFSKAYQKSDLNILYGASQKANSSRGNIEFADVQTEQSPVCPKVRRGWVRGNGKTLYFEPPDEHKGNVARAIFYFAVRYQMKVSQVEEESLRRWHGLDPVDDQERDRHERIFKIQKVRNPFIDHPEMVDMIADF